MPEETRRRILEAAMSLMSIKGYTATTTKEIAQVAGIAEITLFRKYHSKQEILDNLIETYTSSFKHRLFSDNALVYDLEIDLANVSRIYQTFMEENQRIVLLAYKESGIHDEISERLTANPRLMKEYLVGYLEEMKRREEINNLDIDLTVMSFMWMNLGYFSSKFISVKKVAIVPLDTFIEHSVKVFAKGLKNPN
ncbi:TetR/AcrR family transcriptional regulator [Anaerobacillus alkaliphilus]|uniref:TetR/AcrR family transcriptional regulator n=1 Tax=Anaerobacillus alkaliphilus TaxID=1548597 RepID=A0A4Q0VUZ4_9BACI|nr:TetR/AcrR family transcriptional regulator [Anaerobacillus alkaliphilus]RXJ01795.1 TetR/AcrR family transcriptional regulator [Anaerobacillus alkaliphilus]